MVVAFHYITLRPEPGSLLYYGQVLVRPFFISGVDLFFVLSGFLIGGILLDRQQSPNLLRVFWTRRAARILPVYFAVILSFPLGVVLLDPSATWMKGWLAKDPYPLWAYLTFTQNFAMAASGEIIRQAWLAVTWSLAVEEQFYLLLPLVMVALPRRHIVIVAAACIVLALPLRILAWSQVNDLAGYVLLPCRMDTLMFGVVIAWLVRNPETLARVREWRWLVDVCIVALVIFVAFGVGDAALTETLGVQRPGNQFFQPLHLTWLALLWAFLLLRVFIVGDGPFRVALRWQPLAAIGAISYGVYMIHQIVNGLLHGLILGSPPGQQSWPSIGVTVVAFATTILIASVSYRKIERPLIRLAHTVKYEPPR